MGFQILELFDPNPKMASNFCISFNYIFRPKCGTSGLIGRSVANHVAEGARTAAAAVSREEVAKDKVQRTKFAILNTAPFLIGQT